MFKTQWNAEKFPKTYEKGGGLSMTIPDQSLTVRDLIDRQKNGLNLTGVKVPVYHGEDELLPEFNKLDLAEREELKHNNDEEIKELKARLQEYKKSLNVPVMRPKPEVPLKLVENPNPGDDKPK